MVTGINMTTRRYITMNQIVRNESRFLMIAFYNILAAISIVFFRKSQTVSNNTL